MLLLISRLDNKKTKKQSICRASTPVITSAWFDGLASFFTAVNTVPRKRDECTSREPNLGRLVSRSQH